MKVANCIKTELWNRIIDDLLQAGWSITRKYDGFDAGIDYNAFVLEKDDLKIEFTWDNWFEGEIKCEPQLSETLGLKYAVAFNDSAEG
ncbi:MAG: hypothetical protein KF775_00820 [Cyclobacteriaceae bacterium]|nr:hypothetical protein [Cyclobacteriaceae bacterium]